MKWNALFKIVLLFCAVILMASCKNWSFKKIDEQERFQEEWQAVALDQVSSYPSFTSCDSLASNREQYSCFQRKIVQAIQQELLIKKNITHTQLQDTAWAYLVVSDQGLMCVDSLHISEALNTATPDMQLSLYRALDKLPKAIPAYKRGIPVRVRFSLPIVYTTK